MAEETIWKGTSSQWKNFKVYALTVVVAGLCGWLHWGHLQWNGWIFLAVVPLVVWSFWKWLVVKTTVYSLTNERLVTSHGILTKVTDMLELYRVRDMQTVQPLMLRMIGLQNVHVYATDATTASMVLGYLPTADNLGERLRKSVEECRAAKRVRTMDMVNDTLDESLGGGPGTT
jgi:uncharacterized membrane protein YdbT with pleckstrin-like domain